MTQTGKTSVSDAFDPAILESAIRMLAHWGLAHFGDRTDPDAYVHVTLATATESADAAISKVQVDLQDQGYVYADRTMRRMFDRFMRDAEIRHSDAIAVAAAA